MTELVVLGCSATKRPSKARLPAIELYDGPMYRVLRSHLRTHAWPEDTSLAVLSAEHGLIGGLSHIGTYERRMSTDRAAHLRAPVAETLSRWSASHGRVRLFLGKEYLPAIEEPARSHFRTVSIAPGMIGEKLNRLRALLRRRSLLRDTSSEPSVTRRMAYFLPDWDDFVDADFDFEADRFSCDDRAGRREVHLLQLMRPHKLADGVVVSLAQHMSAKGLLRAVDRRSEESLRPRDVRAHYSLQATQWAFGDCGAFSYVSEPRPPIGVESAAALYNLYGFDLGASVDHIPVPFVKTEDGKRWLTDGQRRARIVTTRRNAERFICEVHRRGYGFAPVGVLQGIAPRDYRRQVPMYVEMGYRHLAIGGLVPRSDSDILAIARQVREEVWKVSDRPWLHLFGVFRPRLQRAFREMRIDSFDSASYLRKAWLRSAQNYLGPDGSWYAAIRVPVSADPRTAKRLRAAGVTERKAARLERQAMDALLLFEAGRRSAQQTVRRVLEYDALLERADSNEEDLRQAYLRTLTDKPWRECECPVCSGIGIHVAIFRGLNRNKRRGAHNTLMLFRGVRDPGTLAGGP